MSWRDWWKRKQPKQAVRNDRPATPVVPEDAHAPLRELIFADESLEGVARFVLQQEALGQVVRRPWGRLAQVAAWVAQGDPRRAIEELRRLLEDEGEDARSCFQVWNYLRQLGEAPGPEVAARILGLVIEHSRHGRPEILSAYWDGTARWLDVRGDFLGYTNPAPFMLDDVRRWLGTCSPLVEATPPSTGPRPPPPVGSRCRITVLTPAGLHAREGDWDALWDDAVCGPVLEVAGALTERLLGEATVKGMGNSGVAPWPRRRGPGGGGSPVVH